MLLPLLVREDEERLFNIQRTARPTPVRRSL